MQQGQQQTEGLTPKIQTWRSRLRPVGAETWYQVRLVCKAILFFYVPLAGLLTCLHFPYETDFSRRESPSRTRNFYEAAYGGGQSIRGLDYEVHAREGTERNQMQERMRRFVNEYGLADKRILEVGSGQGELQAVVADYTGLDLSPSVATHYRKPFVVGSVTELPFADSSYDSVWSIWLLEHVPTPEKALLEMRRVVKPEGLIYMAVAWNCPSWAADGFGVRPYSHYNWRGKLVKASVEVRATPLFQLLYRGPIEMIRWAQYTTGQDRHLRFRALEPNYSVFWGGDSDAAVSLESFEVYFWFRSRGDECLSCSGAYHELLNSPKIMIVRVHKQRSGRG